MASSWRPLNPARVSDYYRPHAPLNLSRPPRPGPRQPDCWRPGQRTSPPPVSVNQQQQRGKKDNDRGISKQFRERNNRANDLLRSREANPQRSGSNKLPLGKRQMGMINSIIRSEEQSVEFNKVDRGSRDRHRTLTMEETQKEAPGDVQEKTSSYETANTSAIDTVEPDTSVIKPTKPQPDLPFRLPPPASHEPEWSRTKITETPSLAPNDLIPSTAEHNNKELSPPPNPVLQLRQKLDFGNRVDQCLLKMDKWADAWLSSALTTEDPNPNPDNAWQSFEHCLSMPDILEDSEIVEYEEIPRCELPATETCFGGLKRRRDRGQSSETWVDEAWGGSREMGEEGKDREEIKSNEPFLPPRKRSRDSTFLDSITNDINRTDFRETSVPEFRSSSPDYKRVKMVHIPSAAALREEARMKSMVEGVNKKHSE